MNGKLHLRDADLRGQVCSLVLMSVSDQLCLVASHSVLLASSIMHAYVRDCHVTPMVTKAQATLIGSKLRGCTSLCVRR